MLLPLRRRGGGPGSCSSSLLLILRSLFSRLAFFTAALLLRLWSGTDPGLRRKHVRISRFREAQMGIQATVITSSQVRSLKSGAHTVVCICALHSVLQQCRDGRSPDKYLIARTGLNHVACLHRQDLGFQQADYSFRFVHSLASSLDTPAPSRKM